MSRRVRRADADDGRTGGVEDDRVGRGRRDVAGLVLVLHADGLRPVRAGERERHVRRDGLTAANGVTEDALEQSLLCATRYKTILLVASVALRFSVTLVDVAYVALLLIVIVPAGLTVSILTVSPPVLLDLRCPRPSS